MTDPKEKPPRATKPNGAADTTDGGAPNGEVDPPGLEEALAGGTTAELTKLQEEVDRLTDRHLRLAAEFDNYRKRAEREKADLYVRAQADLAGRLLDGLDDLQRVADHAESADSRTLLDGVRLVEKKLTQVLEASGLEPVDAEGLRFDPELMEALATVAAESAAEDDHVADVFQRGYRFKGQLIRPARVRVKQYEA